MQQPSQPPLPQPPLPPAPPAPPAPPQQDAPKDSGIPYIGSRISLISKTDIRYEGFLFNIDTRQSMVALQSVRSFGTEGRRAEHIPPSPQVLQFAAFKASEIKDLHVCEAAPPAPYSAYPQPPIDQHQPSMQPPMPPQQPLSPPNAKPMMQATTTTTPTLLTPGSVSSSYIAAQQSQQLESHERPSLVQARPTLSPQEQYLHNEQRANAILAQQTNYNESRRQQMQQQHSSSSSDSARTIPGMGGHLLKRKERRVPGSGGPQHESSAAGAAKQDFDFEARLTAFNKEEEFSKLSTEQPKTHYQKSSFFDTISCDALDRLEGHKGRMTGFEERKLNAETFGAVSLNGRRNFRGSRGGGGGSGGSGRGSGGRSGNRRRGRGNGGIGGGQISSGMNV